jgi:hypothetical protein
MMASSVIFSRQDARQCPDVRWESVVQSVQIRAFVHVKFRFFNKAKVLVFSKGWPGSLMIFLIHHI